MSEPVAEPRGNPYVEELETALKARLNEPVTGADLLQALRPIAQALEQIERHRETLEDTVAFVNQLQERLMIVDDRPGSAPFGALIRVRGQAALFLGNGADQPLSRVVPTAVP